MEDGHAKTVDEVLNFFGTDLERGLSTDQIKRNQEKYGPNGKCDKPLNRTICCTIWNANNLNENIENEIKSAADLHQSIDINTMCSGRVGSWKICACFNCIANENRKIICFYMWMCSSDVTDSNHDDRSPMITHSACFSFTR